MYACMYPYRSGCVPHPNLAISVRFHADVCVYVCMCMYVYVYVCVYMYCQIWWWDITSLVWIHVPGVRIGYGPRCRLFSIVIHKICMYVCMYLNWKCCRRWNLFSCDCRGCVWDRRNCHQLRLPYGITSWTRCLTGCGKGIQRGLVAKRGNPGSSKIQLANRSYVWRLHCVMRFGLCF